MTRSCCPYCYSYLPRSQKEINGICFVESHWKNKTTVQQYIFYFASADQLNYLISVTKLFLSILDKKIVMFVYLRKKITKETLFKPKLAVESQSNIVIHLLHVQVVLKMKALISCIAEFFKTLAWHDINLLIQLISITLQIILCIVNHFISKECSSICKVFQRHIKVSATEQTLEQKCPLKKINTANVHATATTC